MDEKIDVPLEEIEETENEVLIDKLQLYLDYGFDLENKIVFLPIPGDYESDSIIIDSVLSQKLIKYLLILDKDRHEIPIKIYMDCRGGDVDPGFGIYDFIKTLKSKVHIIVIGQCMSMASIILQAANKRIMSKNSCLMIHDGSLAIDAESKSSERYAEYAKFQRFITYEIFAEKMKNVKRNSRLPKKIKDIMERNKMLFNGRGFSVNEIENLTTTDLYLTAEEALKLNLIDEILDKGK